MVLTIIYLIAGIGIFFMIAAKPRMLWPAVIFVGVFTSGLMIKGYCLTDEFLFLCIICAVLLLFLTKVLPREKDEQRPLHLIFFLLFVSYMFIESIYGELLLKDPRIFRWSIFYIALGIFAVFVNKKKFVFPEKKELCLIVAVSALIYLIIYLISGLIFEKKLGYYGRLATQGMWWPGPAYIMFFLVLIIPCAIFLLKEESKADKILAFTVFVLILIAADFYESRVALLAMITFFAVSLPMLKIKKLLPVIFCFFVIISCFFWTGNSQEFANGVKKESSVLIKSAEVLWSPRVSDLDRNLQVKIAFAAVTNNWKNFLFGYGLHSSHYVLVEYKNAFYAKYIPNAPVRDVVRTTAFAAMLTDTGFVGLFLFLVNFIFAASRIAINLKNDLSHQKYLLISIVFVAFMWVFVANIQDIILLYLLIMPRGILDNMSLKGAENNA